MTTNNQTTEDYDEDNGDVEGTENKADREEVVYDDDKEEVLDQH
jgi:hypothetical protein